MKKIVHFSVVSLWVLLASGFLTRLWLTEPDKFPSFPESMAVWLVSSSGLPKGDVAILVGFGVSIAIVSIFTFFAWFFWRRIKIALTNRARGRAKSRP